MECLALIMSSLTHSLSLSSSSLLKQSLHGLDLVYWRILVLVLLIAYLRLVILLIPALPLQTVSCLYCPLQISERKVNIGIHIQFSYQYVCIIKVISPVSPNLSLTCIFIYYNVT